MEQFSLENILSFIKTYKPKKPDVFSAIKSSVDC